MMAGPTFFPMQTSSPDTGVAKSAEDPIDVLRDVFGYDEFRPGQRRIIEAVLRGDDCIGVMPTGAGKSLTFQLPARMLPGTVVVLSPRMTLTTPAMRAVYKPASTPSARWSSPRATKANMP